MSGSTIRMDWRFVASNLFSRAYLIAAGKSYAEALFVGWGLAHIGDFFYPRAGAIVGIVPSLAVTIMGLNAASLAKPVLAKAGVDVIDDPAAEDRFSGSRVSIYVVAMLWGIYGATFWQDGPPPFILLAFLFGGFAYAYGYALARIPNFTVAYLTGATPEHERVVMSQLYSHTVATALPGVGLAAYLLATAGVGPSYVGSFLTWQTFVTTLIPLLYFPYYVAVSYNLLVAAKSAETSA